MVDNNNKLKSNEKLASQPELVELKKIRMELEATKKAFAESKKSEENIGNLTEIYKKHVAIVNNHLAIVDPTINTKCKFQDKPQGCKFGHRCKNEHSEMGEKTDCSYWLEKNCKFSEKKCRGLHEPAKKGINVISAINMEQLQIAQEGMVNTLDLSYWMENCCRFSDKKCRGLHNPVKKGCQIRQQNESILQDFQQSMTQVTAQIQVT